MKKISHVCFFLLSDVSRTSLDSQLIFFLLAKIKMCRHSFKISKNDDADTLAI